MHHIFDEVIQKVTSKLKRSLKYYWFICVRLWSKFAGICIKFPILRVMMLQGCFLLLLAVIGALVIAVQVKKWAMPEKTWWNCFISVCLVPFRYLRIGPYSSPVTLSYAVKVAIKETNLNDFGDSEFSSNYDVVMSGSEQNKLKYHNIGFIMAKLELTITMVRKLKFIQYLKDSPDVLDVPVRKPVFVVGLPRTGTTFLHRLLSLDPAVRAPLLWELLSPVPGVLKKSGALSDDFAKDAAFRAEAVRLQIKKRQDAGDRALENIHEIGYDVPEECLMAMSDEIPCLTQNFYAVYMNTTEFFSKVGKAQIERTYRHYRKVLQLLAFQRDDIHGARSWMLKSPIHLFYIQELAAVFPDATVIWTHRHPVSAVPSLCSLLKAVHKLYYEPSTHDDAALGRAVRDLSADLLERVPRDLAQSGLNSANIVYDSFIADPLGTVKGLYAQLGWVFTAEYEAILKDFLVADAKKRKAAKGKSGVLHRYTPEDFHLTADDLTQSRQFADYVKKYNIPMSVN